MIPRFAAGPPQLRDPAGSPAAIADLLEQHVKEYEDQVAATRAGQAQLLAAITRLQQGKQGAARRQAARGARQPRCAARVQSSVHSTDGSTQPAVRTCRSQSCSARGSCSRGPRSRTPLRGWPSSKTGCRRWVPGQESWRCVAWVARLPAGGRWCWGEHAASPACSAKRCSPAAAPPFVDIKNQRMLCWSCWQHAELASPIYIQ